MPGTLLRVLPLLYSLIWFSNNSKNKDYYYYSQFTDEKKIWNMKVTQFAKYLNIRRTGQHWKLSTLIQASTYVMHDYIQPFLSSDINSCRGYPILCALDQHEFDCSCMQTVPACWQLPISNAYTSSLYVGFFQHHEVFWTVHQGQPSNTGR